MAGEHRRFWTRTSRAYLRRRYWLSLRRYNSELCQDCGGRNQFAYRTPDPLWEQVTGQAWQRDDDGLWRYHDGERWVYEAEGTCISLLCPECFEKRAKALRLRLFWTCEADPTSVQRIAK